MKRRAGENRGLHNIVRACTSASALQRVRDGLDKVAGIWVGWIHRPHHLIETRGSPYFIVQPTPLVLCSHSFKSSGPETDGSGHRPQSTGECHSAPIVNQGGYDDVICALVVIRDHGWIARLLGGLNLTVGWAQFVRPSGP